jgi:hypothetical protein
VKKKLLFLNLALLAIAGFTAYRIRDNYLEAAARQRRMLEHRPAAVKPPPPAPVRAVAPVSPAQYAEVAQKMLFTADRSPAVILDPVKPPPEKPVPPFPVAHGVILFGDLPPTILLSQRGRNDQRGYKVGDTVGGFTVASIDSTDVVFTWEGKEFKKAISDLVDYSTPVATSASRTPAAPAENTSSLLTEAADLSKPKPAAASLSPQELSKPGAPMGDNFYGCNAGDSSPAGTVVNGLVKREAKNPFSPGGKSCYWEASH